MARPNVESNTRPVVRNVQNRANAPTADAPKVQESTNGSTDQIVATARTNTGRRTPITHKDLTIKYMMLGIDALTPILNESNDPVGALDKVISTLVDNDQDTAELVKLRDFYGEMRNIGQPGRQPVKVGDHRDYSVQQQGDEGDLFVRVPLITMPVNRGEKVRVTFEENRIVISLLGE
jgi:hypothetical protein